MSKKTQLRLNRLLAQSGACSRRKADQLLKSGHITVNGHIITQLGYKVDPYKDKVQLDGHPVLIQQNFVYYLFHKPKNVLTTLDDPKGRPCMGDFLKGFPVFPVGRLDWDTEGMLILTNDGEFAHSVLHPRFGVTKTYLAKLNGRIKASHIQRLQKGVRVLGKIVKAKSLIRLKKGLGKYDWVKITISEGKNQQVKRMFEKVGFDILKLQRIMIGRLTLGKLKKGDMRPLTPKDLSKIHSHCINLRG